MLLVGLSGQRAEPAVAELDLLAMNSPMGSAVPNSHDDDYVHDFAHAMLNVSEITKYYRQFLQDTFNGDDIENWFLV
jgi:hypothetical protein